LSGAQFLKRILEHPAITGWVRKPMKAPSESNPHMAPNLFRLNQNIKPSAG
jgi:hypothetical protein